MRKYIDSEVKSVMMQSVVDVPKMKVATSLPDKVLMIILTKSQATLKIIHPIKTRSRC